MYAGPFPACLKVYAAPPTQEEADLRESGLRESIVREEALNPHLVPRDVSAIGMETTPDKMTDEPHAHRKAQLIYAARGMVRCNVAKGLWMVPPQCALWIPGGMPHAVCPVGDVELYILFLDPEVASIAPSECCTLSINPLLRELVIAASRLPPLYDRDGPPGRLIQTMLDELAVAPVERSHLPLPADQRLRKIADALIAQPSTRATIAYWARHVLMSERSLVRLVRNETGMGFGAWRQQFQIMLALERLARGDKVQTVALELGYGSVSAFITMFRKAMGQPPGRYLAASPERAVAGRATTAADQ